MQNITFTKHKILTHNHIQHDFTYKMTGQTVLKPKSFNGIPENNLLITYVKKRYSVCRYIDTTVQDILHHVPNPVIQT